MYPTLNELFNKSVASHGDKIALRMLIPKERKRGRGIQLILNEISYARLGEMVGRLATALDGLGVKKGTRSPSSPSPAPLGRRRSLLCSGAEPLSSSRPRTAAGR